MKSPFPGMDPYLEDPPFWEGFHHVFITECMYALSACLPDRYVANVGERVELVSRDDPAAQQYLPDVVVTRGRSGWGESPPELIERGGGTALVQPPVTIPSLDSIEVRHAHIEITRMPDRKLITSIELLSPWNKYGEGIGEYRSKRRSLVSHGVHVVEVDLLRRGRRTELAGTLPVGHYFAMVFRADRRPDVNVYAWDLRQPLPTISVPLASPDSDVQLELAKVVASTYERGRYDRKLRYDASPPEPLSPVDLEWVTQTKKRANEASSGIN